MKIRFFDTMNKRASSTTYGAIANSDVIKIGIDFELNFAAMTRAFVCLFHGV